MEDLDMLKDLELDAGAARSAVRWRRYRHTVRSRWWVVVITLGLAMSIAGWYNSSKAAQFRSFGRMMVSGQIAVPGTASANEEGAANFFGTQIALMESQFVRTAAEERVRTTRPELSQCEVTITVTQQPRASIFVLTAIGDQPEYTQALLDAVMQEYINIKKEMRSEKSNTTVSAIAEELEVLEKKIKAEDDDLVAFQKQNNVNFLEAEGNSAGTYLSGIDRKLASLNTEYQLLNLLTLDQQIDLNQSNGANAKEAGRQGQEGSISSGAIGASADYVRAKQQIQVLKAKIAQFSQYLKPKHPIIVQLNNEISLQEKMIVLFQEQSKEQLQGQRESVKLQIDNLQNERKAWSERALDLGARTAQYVSLKSKVDRLKALYEHLLTSMQAVDVNKNIDQNVVAILEKAMPAKSVKLGFVKALITALVSGLAAGFGLLFVSDLLNGRIVSAEEFSALFNERILGRIPSEKVKELTLLYPGDPGFSEAFSGVRSSMVFHPYRDIKPKVFLVTSALPGEGKSTIATNLAATLSLGGANTLLVDGDLRRGGIHKTFNLGNEKGLSDIISCGHPWQDLVKRCEFTNLSIITRGKDIELLGKHLLSQHTDEFLHDIRSQFDYIVVDSAPVLAVDDTTILAPKVDGVIFVVRLTFSPRKAIQAALALLKDRQVRIFGAILNALDSKIDGSTYYSYSSYYAAPASVRSGAATSGQALPGESTRSHEK